jgi:hypothetical protein
METLKIDNTLIEVKNYPICFVNAKLNLFNDFFKGTWKTMFEARHGKLKQLDFDQRHLWSGDIGKLIQFLNDEIDALELQIDSEVELQFVRDLLKELPPIQEKDVWFLFQKKVETLTVKPIYGTHSINNDLKKEDENSSI